MYNYSKKTPEKVEKTEEAITYIVKNCHNREEVVHYFMQSCQPATITEILDSMDYEPTMTQKSARIHVKNSLNEKKGIIIQMMPGLPH